MRVLSADWVLPVEAPPIADGAVAFENGRITAVGVRDELGSDVHYDGAAIVPGFVNAHTHLEYAVYGGFGDGLADFARWIALHTERKRRIGWDDPIREGDLLVRIGEHREVRMLLGGKCLVVGECVHAYHEVRGVERANESRSHGANCIRPFNHQ